MKRKILRVTTTNDYCIEMYGNITEINGWSIEEVIQDWFKDNSPDSYHATRDSYRVGGSRKFIKSELIDMKDWR